MKNHKHIFQGAERLKPSTQLWQKIEAKVHLKSKAKISPSLSLKSNLSLGSSLSSNRKSSQLWHKPIFRWAACMAFAAGMVGTVLTLRHRSPEILTALIKADTTLALDENEVLLDPELLVWDADLGETEFLETNQIVSDDSAEEVL